jgi:hypothetical protein
MSMKQNILIGKTITNMKIASDREAILFVCGDDEITVQCDADCCSHTWIEGIELPARGFPALVSAVEDVELNADADDQNGELQFYGLKITTDSGYIIIDYRNESNGYYGGSLTWPEESHYGGVYGQNDSNLDWQAIQP